MYKRQELPWPDQICDVPRTVQIMRAHSTMKELEQAARLRSRQELLDQADLIYRLHWCCVSARLKGCAAPQGLDEGVVMERHRALFWLAGCGEAEWDDVDPVSYTHLDVYKRQVHRSPQTGFPSSRRMFPSGHSWAHFPHFTQASVV